MYIWGGWLRGHLHRMEIVGRPLSDRILARSLNDLSKAMKKSFLCEILVRSLISQPSLLQGVNIWINWKIPERSLGQGWGHWALLESSLSVYWVFIEHSLSICWAFAERLLSVRWAFVERLLPLVIIERLFWTESNFEETMMMVEITGWSLTDHWEILAIAACPLKGRWEIWPFF